MRVDEISSQETIEGLSRHCPECISTYMHCANRINNNRQVFFTKTMVTEEMSESWTKFKNNIKKLACESLLEWHPFNGGIMVTLSREDY